MNTVSSNHNTIHEQSQSTNGKMNAGTSKDHHLYELVLDILAEQPRMENETRKEDHNNQETINVSAAAVTTIKKYGEVTTNPNMRRNVPRTTASQDLNYLERRRMNNAAAKRSRDNANRKSVEDATKLLSLEEANKRLKLELNIAYAILADLHSYEN